MCVCVCVWIPQECETINVQCVRKNVCVVVVCSVCATKNHKDFLNAVSRAQWSERLDTFGSEIYPITYVRNGY